MIRYGLKCENDHSFDSWFQSAEAYEALREAGLVTCPDCGAAKVEKVLMAPTVRPARKASVPAPKETPDLTKPEGENARMLAELRRKIESESDYVGLNFAAEARAMHEGELPHRSIYGEAKAHDAKQLLEDGVPVAPLPFVPRNKTN